MEGPSNIHELSDAALVCLQRVVAATLHHAAHGLDPLSLPRILCQEAILVNGSGLVQCGHYLLAQTSAEAWAQKLRRDRPRQHLDLGCADSSALQCEKVVLDHVCRVPIPRHVHEERRDLATIVAPSQGVRIAHLRDDAPEVRRPGGRRQEPHHSASGRCAAGQQGRVLRQAFRLPHVPQRDDDAREVAGHPAALLAAAARHSHDEVSSGERRIP
mmetsp:Transcript_69421/g.201464  ORF Transcript_69421/g.201464 Transcript_69421/m.201464 type:complete len:215 (-) Transcript_69421:395-1039(-)